MNLYLKIYYFLFGLFNFDESKINSRKKADRISTKLVSLFSSSFFFIMASATIYFLRCNGVLLDPLEIIILNVISQAINLFYLIKSLNTIDHSSIKFHNVNYRLAIQLFVFLVATILVGIIIITSLNIMDGATTFIIRHK